MMSNGDDRIHTGLYFQHVVYHSCEIIMLIDKHQ